MLDGRDVGHLNYISVPRKRNDSLEFRVPLCALAVSGLLALFCFASLCPMGLTLFCWLVLNFANAGSLS